MTRLIVKNLPNHITTDRLKEHFSQKGYVTDVKLNYTKDGLFRKFGFVGFKETKEAEAAVEFFNQTYIDTSKISVDMAKGINSEDLPRAWSKYSKGSSAFRDREDEQKEYKEHQLSKKQKKFEKKAKKARELQKEVNLKKKVAAEKMMNELFGNVEKDSKLQEFLDISKARKDTKTWANDDTALNVQNSKAGKTKNIKFNEQGESICKEDDNDSSDDEDYQDLAKTVAGSSSIGSGSVSISEKMSGLIETTDARAEVSPNEQKNPDTIETTTAAAGVEDVGEFQSKLHATIEASVSDSGRLFVRNLPYDVEEKDIVSLFKRFGPLSEVYLPVDKETKKPYGIAYIMFLLPENAVSAWQKLDNTIFQGRLLHILPSKKKKNASVDNEDDDSGLSFKQKKEREAKKKAGSDYNWNSLFMRSDAVADAISKKLKVKKSDILNKNAESMAVRMALGETHIILSTKEYFKKMGVNMKCFEDGVGKQKRSNRVIILKNIPSDINESEISKMFGQYGDLGRIILPHTNTIAIIEYINPNEAKKGFMSLAYTKFRNVPLYLEWAPENCLLEQSEADKKQESGKQNDEGAAQEDDDDDVEADGMGCTVFVKNLNFDTTKETLSKVFKKVGNVKSVTIATKKNPKDPEKPLSMGFGFVEYATQKLASECLKKLQKVKVDHHVLELKISSRQANNVGVNSKKSKKQRGKLQSTKLMVRNVPFEANPRELKQLFGTFGQLKSTRIPKKFDGTHRGFAFVEFINKQEAQNAFDSLGSTHFYGRRLVIEWADEQQSVESLREATGKRYSEEQQSRVVNKKIKL